ncbi:MAG: leucine--tRNA ligase [Bacteroidota bacterium]
MSYPFRSIEPRWQAYWEQQKTFRTEDPPPGTPKAYVLDMFPYPSGSGLHVGHPEGYTATDILCRYLRMKGVRVLHPIGWDAFGLPAERYAMQTNIHPRVTTAQNIATFRRQIRMLGLSYDWDREVDTTHPDYYRWTQWIFLRIYDSWYDTRAGRARPVSTLVEELEREGTCGLDCETRLTAAGWRGLSRKEKHDFLAGFRLAYLAEVPVNWCEALGTVLANEEVDEWAEKGYTVERRPMRQWMMRITAYAERFLEDAGRLDWPASTLEQQRNWIGRSEGAEILFPAAGTGAPVRVFTTRPDTLFGATYMVLAPEHPLVDRFVAAERRAEVDAYRERSRTRTDRERGMDQAKTGEFTGGYVQNPATGRPIPVWIADYVLMGYGTGAIMAVPGHDERDHAFALAHGLPILEVVAGGDVSREAFSADGTSVASSNAEVSLDGLSSVEARKRITAWLEARGLGHTAVQYKLRDWLFSRQRYWGEPIPIMHLEDGTMTTVPEEQLPLHLPDLKRFQPSGTTESPLALAREWVEVTDPATGLRGRRETNTMPQWAGSCWYYLRFIDPRNGKAFCDPARERTWMPVDLYVGGAEHAVLHLLYARFWHKVLYDLGHVSTPEPFVKLRHQGIILGEDSSKMSKSRGNVVNPDDIVQEYGADAMRLFEMFMGPLEDMKPWNTRGVEGVQRFLNRVWRLYAAEDGSLHPDLKDVPAPAELRRTFHATVRKVGEDIEALRFNTAIAQMMIFVNEATKAELRPREVLEPFLLLLAPFAPHCAEELWRLTGHGESLARGPWPAYDPLILELEHLEVVVQVNGKVRSRISVRAGTPEKELEALALADPDVQRHMEGKQFVRAVAVKDRIVNLVVR